MCTPRNCIEDVNAILVQDDAILRNAILMGCGLLIKVAILYVMLIGRFLHRDGWLLYGG